MIEPARTLLLESHLDKRYWAEAVNTAVYVRNRCPNRAINNEIPEEVWSNKRVSVRHLRVFGCKAKCFIPKEKRQKFDAKSEPKIFVGYCEESKAYRLLDANHSGKLTKAINVVFFENQFVESKSDSGV